MSGGTEVQNVRDLLYCRKGNLHRRVRFVGILVACTNSSPRRSVFNLSQPPVGLREIHPDRDGVVGWLRIAVNFKR